MGKSLEVHIKVRGKKAIIYGTILFIVVISFLYLISVVLLDAPLFFILGLILGIIAYIKNIISAYKDMKQLEETEGESSQVEIDTYNDFKK